MYNKVKRKLAKASAILSIILGGIIILSSFFALSGGISEGEGFSIVLALLAIALGVMLIIYGSKQCKHPVLKDGVWEDRKPIYIAFCVLLGIAVFLTIFNGYIYFILGAVSEFLADDYYIACLLSFAGLELAVVALALNIPSMILKTEKKTAEPQVVAQPVINEEVLEPVIQEDKTEFEQKVAQLSNLKESGAITEEQYKDAVDKLINNFVK